MPHADPQVAEPVAPPAADTAPPADPARAGDPRDLLLTFVPGDLVPAGGTFMLWGATDIEGAATALGLPVGDAATLTTVRLTTGPDGHERFQATDVRARAVAVLPAVRVLAALPAPGDWPAWRSPSDAVLAWSVAAKLALEFVAGALMVPFIEPGGRPGQGAAFWRAAPPADGRIARLAEAFPLAAHAIRSDGIEPSVRPADDLLVAFLDAVADACARSGRRPEIDPRRRGPKRPWPEMFASALSGSEPIVEGLRLPIEDVAEGVADWSSSLLGRDTRAVAHLGVRLEAPEPTGDDMVDSEASWQLHLGLQATDDDASSMAASEVWAAPGGLVELGGRRVEAAPDALVRGIAVAAELFDPVGRALDEPRPTTVTLQPTEVAQFLAEGSEALSSAGIGVRVPVDLRATGQRRLRARMRIGATAATDGSLDGAPLLDRSQIASFSYEVAIGDDPITREEFAELTALKQPLVRWRGQWVRIDHDEVDRLGELLGTTGTIELTEALASALAGQHEVADLGYIETVTTGDVARLVDRIRGADGPSDPRIEGIVGELRPYQVRGVGWLQSLSELGLGAVLADEMGLGKTLQAIALLTSRAGDQPSLVVCPTSVVGNWEREIARFAPELKVLRYHGTERVNRISAFKPGTIAVTSYALLRRDGDFLADVDWDVVVFDEAQQVKNASSKGARAARALPARMRVAMTGTPVENRLSELWAIIDLTNPGLLGNQRRFNERFAVPVERWRDADAASRLRSLVAPFVMRRLKSDPHVAVDLPPKQQVTVVCSLTREQATLYQAAVDRAFAGKGMGANAFERRGRILALLTALKQICNHPAHYLRDGGALTGRSGKLARATEILGEIVASGDFALVFTQYREMGELLATHLGDQLGLPEVPFLHGGVPLAKRDEMVQRFQEEEGAPPILLVSLRAGGTGLNLTRATEVIHFDRWWNPAVEAQATDRAHRIGQTRPVTVHALVTAGTIEERIADLLERKKALADAVVGEGESWINDLDDDALRDLVELSADDVEDEDDAA